MYLFSRNKQQGITLVVSLIFLLIITLGSVTGMKISAVDERMTANYRDRQVAFQMAEAALVEAEAWVENTDFEQTDLYGDSGCSSSGSLTCFKSDCTNGLCNTVDYSSSTSGCTLEDIKPWTTASYWETTGKYRTITITFGSESVVAKYQVEFRCYVPFDMTTNPEPSDLPPSGNWSELYRITVRTEGTTDDSVVILQSTYKKS